MDLYRFFTPHISPGRVELPDDQAHHALHVLRLATGAPVEIFDGQGNSGHGKLLAAKRTAAVEIESVEHQPPPERHLTLATAVPKADRAEWLIEQASQLNVGAVQWLASERGVVRPKEGGGKMDKWRRLAIESAKQCGRNWVMTIEPMRDLKTALHDAMTRGERILWLEPRQGISMEEALCNTPARITALVGPEGGWSDPETALLESHAQAGRILRVRLTPTFLRIETACAAVAAVVAIR